VTDVVLAHGGAGGAAVEAAFLLVPVVAFFVLSRWSKRRERSEQDGDAVPDPRTGPPP
jgi:ABC-type Fe3+ transport system permease subunit